MCAPGPIRQALEAVLRTGASGTADVLARRAGVCINKARHTLRNLRREGVAQSRCLSGAVRSVGRRPVVYSLRDQPRNPPFDSLQFASQVWR